MWLIAIDEAGYGPKLGPLVIAGTLWHRHDEQPTSATDAASMLSIDQHTVDPFQAIATPVRVGDTVIRVDDSKQIYRGGSLVQLHQIFSVAHRFCGRTESTLTERLVTLIPQDQHVIRNVPWLGSLFDPRSYSLPLASAEETRTAIDQWDCSPWKLRDITARMIDAKTFNRYCGVDHPTPVESHVKLANKSDLLGEMSVRLAGDLLDRVSRQDEQTASGETVQVFFDRHGGRRYYAGVIQAFFDCEPVRVVSESKTQSVYETIRHGHPVRLHFTVKGDRHVPVALSSLHAKYLRELAMASLNDYFRRAMRTNPKSEAESDENRVESVFRPTAGYPRDADRFIEMIRPLMRSDEIADADLIRCR